MRGFDRLGRRVKRWLRAHGGPAGSVVAVRTDAPEFVLTYDDGPEPGATESVLQTLAHHGATATFFVLLTRVRQYPEIIREAAAAGHEIALHGPDHRPISRMSYDSVRRRTSEAKAELEDVVGRSVEWFRPPYGLQSVSSFRAVQAVGLRPVLWGPTSGDSRQADDADIVARALRGATNGAILLCHDSYAGLADGGRSNNPPKLDRGRLADQVLHAYAELGLAGRSLSAALESGEAVRGIWFKR